MGFIKYVWGIPQEIVDRYSSMVIELPKTGEIGERISRQARATGGRNWWRLRRRTGPYA